MNLMDIRNNIDRIDRQLLALLHQRMEYVLQADKHKTATQDREREAHILENVTSQASPLLDESFIVELYKFILVKSRKLQEKRWKLVGFSGEYSAWGELAVHAFGAGMVLIPCSDFRDVFARVANHDLEFGAVPVENSIEGSVTEVNDLLMGTDLKIVAETVIPIHHHLLVIPGTHHQEIKCVYSSPQALSQCREFLIRNKLEARPFYNAAGTARWLAHEQQRSAGVIASRLAAELYGLEIIKENIEDHPENATRFVLLSTQPETGPADKCTIVFSTPNRAGAIFDVLRVFAENGINLTRIESRPIRTNLGTFAFLLDFQGKPDDPAVSRALEDTKKKTILFKNLGFYREAPR